MSIIDLFLEAYREAKRKNERQKANELFRQTKDTEKAFRALIYRYDDGERFHVSGNHITFGLKSEPQMLRRVMVDQRYIWQLWGKCPRCDKSMWSVDCTTVAEIGRQMVDFQPNAWDNHACPDPPLPWQERLRLAWRIIREGR